MRFGVLISGACHLALLLLGGFLLIAAGALWAANYYLAFTPPTTWIVTLTDAAALLTRVLAVPVVLNTVVGAALIGLYKVVQG